MQCTVVLYTKRLVACHRVILVQLKYIRAGVLPRSDINCRKGGQSWKSWIEKQSKKENFIKVYFFPQVGIFQHFLLFSCSRFLTTDLEWPSGIGVQEIWQDDTNMYHWGHKPNKRKKQTNKQARWTLTEAYDIWFKLQRESQLHCDFTTARLPFI